MEATLSFFYGDPNDSFQVRETLTLVSPCELGTHLMPHEDQNSARI